jgi:transcriptional regulator
MYTPAHFREERREVLDGLIRAFPLATLVAQLPEGLEATHVPLLLRDGVLLGHVARGNPLAGAAGAPVVAIFSGPEHYISPNWYASKAAEPRVVPTWNYIAVHAHGALETFTERERLLEIVTALTERFEADQPQPWSVDDAPRDYIDRMCEAITGIAIPVARLEGKWKVSQNRTAGDRASVAEALAGHPMGVVVKEAL